jgi:2Fe-2S ferredoxin
MPKINILPHTSLCPNGAVIEAEAGDNLCKVLLKNSINIEHACDMSCACTTCHVIVIEGFDQLPTADDSEEDLLGMAWGLSPKSRLSCQVLVPNFDITISIPKYTINHARE